MSNSHISNILADEIVLKINEHCSKIFKEISDTYPEVKYETLMDKYCVETNSKSKKTKKKPPKKDNICMAKKADGYQCTRRKKAGGDYCGKHIKKLKFGRIDDELRYSDKTKYIKTKRENIDGEYYLVDEQNLVYSCSKTHPLLLGKKIGDKLVSTKKCIEDIKRTEKPQAIKIEIV
jgi:hypothetical protein